MNTCDYLKTSLDHEFSSEPWNRQAWASVRIYLIASQWSNLGRHLPSLFFGLEHPPLIAIMHFAAVSVRFGMSTDFHALQLSEG